MKFWLKSALMAALAVGMASCTPSAHTFLYESRGASDSGLNIAGKSIAVVYLESPDGRDSLYNNRFADKFAAELESEYFAGAPSVDVFRKTWEADVDYSAVENISSMVMELGKDVVFIVDIPQRENEKTLFSKLYVYDSMAEVDSVLTRVNSASVKKTLPDKQIAQVLASAMVQDFLPNWNTDMATILYYEWGSDWIEALVNASDMNWARASDLWLKCYSNTSGLERSCAAYNLAVACYIEGEYGLASEWLDKSDAIYPISLSDELRDKIVRR